MLLGELRNCSQFVVDPASMQTNQGVTAEVVHKREDLIPGEFGTAVQEFFEWNTFPLLHDGQ